MTVFIILLVITLASIYLCSKTFYYDNMTLTTIGFILSILFGIWFLVHIVGWSLASYEYNILLAEREAFSYSLKSARESGNEYESATITKQVYEWNAKLTKGKYNNTTFLLDDWYDDRIENIEPIK